MAKSKQNPVTRANKTTPSPRSGLVGRPEIRILISLFVIAGLVLAFGHIAEEVIEGDSAKFDQTVILLFRHANDLSNPIGPPWMEEMAATSQLWAATQCLSSSPALWFSIFCSHSGAPPRFGSHSRS